MAAGPPHPLTLTHARLRAKQGDRRGAIAILERLVASRPDDDEARALLQQVRRDRGRARGGTATRRKRRLEAWLLRITDG